jgi:heptosyltransferase-3
VSAQIVFVLGQPLVALSTRIAQNTVLCHERYCANGAKRWLMLAPNATMNSAVANARPLVVRFGALGDMVLLTVLIRHLYARFGQPVDIVGSGSWTQSLLESQPGVGNLYIVGSRRWPYWVSCEQQKLVSWLRARGPSATWLGDMDNAKSRWLLQRAGWQPEQCIEMMDSRDLPGSHMCDLILRFAYRTPPALGSDVDSLPTNESFGQLHVSDAQRLELDKWLAIRGIRDQAYVLVQPGNKRTMRRGSRQRGSNSKYWPEQHWAAVLRGIRELHPHHAVLMLGVPAEADLNDEILALAGIGNAYNVAHDLPVPRLMALAERAFGLISVDTGPAHLAAAVGCAVVTLFGKANPVIYAPRGPNARAIFLTGTHEGQQSMLGIQPEQVLAAWQNLHVIAAQ